MKFYGQIGFVKTVEVRPGINKNIPEERPAYGDILSNVRRWDNDGNVNDDISVTNRISIVAERFFYENLGAMRYCKWNGTVWAIKSAEVVRPRIILTLGGVYNGEQENPEEEGSSEGEETPDEP